MGMAESIEEHFIPFRKSLYQTNKIEEHSSPTNLIYFDEEYCDTNLPCSTYEPFAVTSLYADTDSIQDIEIHRYYPSQKDKLQKTDSNFKNYFSL
jgi:hypothetical protein